MSVLFCGVGWADTVGYYRFENNLSNSAGTGTAGYVLGGGSASYSTSVPVAIVPNTGLADTASLSLSPSAPVAFSYAFPFDTPGDATLEFWVNPTASPTGEEDLFWTTMAGGDANRFNIFLYPYAGGLSFELDYRDANGTIHPIFNPQYGGPLIPYVLPYNAWTFVAVVRSGNTYSVYFDDDSTPAATNTDPDPNLPTSTGWTLDGRPYLGQNCCLFYGLVDEVRLSDSALSPDQFLDSPVPEPASGILLLTGYGALIALRRFRRK
jgi:hypothetical protein